MTGLTGWEEGRETGGGGESEMEQGDVWIERENEERKEVQQQQRVERKQKETKWTGEWTLRSVVLLLRGRLIR